MAPAADLPGQCACSIYARLVVLRLGLPRGRLHVSACRFGCSIAQQGGGNSRPAQLANCPVCFQALWLILLAFPDLTFFCGLRLLLLLCIALRGVELQA